MGVYPRSFAILGKVAPNDLNVADKDDTSNSIPMIASLSSVAAGRKVSRDLGGRSDDTN